jgi:hypothetical protein
MWRMSNHQALIFVAAVAVMVALAVWMALWPMIARTLTA